MTVFRENHTKMRIEFFKQPLVRYLWQNIFIQEYADEITSYLRFVRSNKDQGELKYFRLMQELHALEKAFNIRMVPEQARDEKNLAVFTDKEQYVYDLENCFHNKRQGKRIYEEMR